MAFLIVHPQLLDGRTFRVPSIELSRLDPRKIDLGDLDFDIDLNRLRELELDGLDPRPVVEQTRRVLHDSLPEPEPTEINVVLSRHGDRLYAGPDHARFGLSSVLARSGIATLEIPAYRGSNARFHAMKRCVRDRFDGYAVNVLTEAPAKGDYMVVHIGGHPEMFGMKDTIQGLAPHTGRLIPNAPVFVFDHAKPNSTDLCDVVAHEVGHAIGLDHTRLCTDIMSYGDCGKKSFRDHEAHCGEYDNRACVDGHETQNSARMLEEHVGRREAAPRVS